MPKYLIHASYTPEGLRGLLKDGGTKRRDAAEALVKSVGGTMEAFYFSFGENDAFVIMDVPDNMAAAAAAMTVAATGGVAAATTVLITPEEMDEATKRATSYTAPGG